MLSKGFGIKKDIPALRLMTEAVHEHGALAAIELTHSGHNAINLYSRIPTMSPVDYPINFLYPKQARRMSKKKTLLILEGGIVMQLLMLRRLDLILFMFYAGHGMSLAQTIYIAKHEYSF